MSRGRSSTSAHRTDGGWNADNDDDDYVSDEDPEAKDDVVNIVVRDIWLRSRLSPELLEQVYDLVDRRQRGRLSRDEFVVGTWLIDHCLRGRRLPTRRELTDDVFESGGPMARLGVKVPKRLKQAEKKWLRPAVNTSAKPDGGVGRSDNSTTPDAPAQSTTAGASAGSGVAMDKAALKKERKRQKREAKELKVKQRQLERDAAKAQKLEDKDKRRRSIALARQSD